MMSLNLKKPLLLMLLSFCLLPSSPAAANGEHCLLSIDVDLSGRYYYSNGISASSVELEIRELLAGKGYTARNQASYIEPDLYLSISTDLDHLYSSGDNTYTAKLTVKLSKTGYSRSSPDNAIFFRQDEGSIYCRRWTGWASHFKSSDDQTYFSLPANAIGAIADWNNRCGTNEKGENLSASDYAAYRLHVLLMRHIADLPSCESK